MPQRQKKADSKRHSPKVEQPLNLCDIESNCLIADADQANLLQIKARCSALQHGTKFFSLSLFTVECVLRRRHGTEERSDAMQSRQLI
jgi:hypothetical protein